MDKSTELRKCKGNIFQLLEKYLQVSTVLSDLFMKRSEYESKYSKIVGIDSFF